MPPPRKPQRPSTTGTPPVVLVKWYDVAKWLLERVDSFPKNQRFIFGQRIASDALDILALLVEASYRRDKVALLEDANRSAFRLAATHHSRAFFFGPALLRAGPHFLLARAEWPKRFADQTHSGQHGTREPWRRAIANG